MEVSGQLQASDACAALSAGGETPVGIKGEAGCTKGPVLEAKGMRKNLLPCWEMRPNSPAVQPVAYCYTEREKSLSLLESSRNSPAGRCYTD
jgi:hypothetical protein